MASQSLLDVWEAAASSPFEPTIPKNAQLTVGFILLITSFILTGVFGLNPSLKMLPLAALPASLTFAFGAVYMICAVGVYV